MFIGIRDFHKNSTDQDVIIAMDMSEHVGFRPLTRKNSSLSHNLHHICPDNLAGEVSPELDQLASAGFGYGGSDGTSCLVSKTMTRTDPLIYGPCPSDAKAVCKKRIGRLKDYGASDDSHPLKSVEGIGNLGLLQQKDIKHEMKSMGNDEALELEYKSLMTVSDILQKLPLTP